MAISLDDCLPILKLCDRFQSRLIDLQVWNVLSMQLKTTTRFDKVSPWELFRMAANRGDAQVCGKAVAAFQRHGYEFDDICSQPAGFYEGIPLRYVAALLTGNYRWCIKYRSESTYLQCSWGEVAKRFSELGQGGSDLRSARQ
jgi:hypothetical protein